MRTKKNTYSYRLLAIWEQKNEEEKMHDEEFKEKLKQKSEEILKRIRGTEKNWKVFVNGLGRVKSF